MRSRLASTLAAVILCLVAEPAPHAFGQEASAARFQSLGNPLEQKYTGPRIYARNVWDMRVFDGQLFIGYGNSSNTGPGRNAGPVPIVAYNPQTQEFKQEYSVQDEQVDVFYEFNGRLAVPGHDPKEPWQWGNFYRRDSDGKWTKFRNIPGGIHTYCMHEKDGVLFAGLGVKEGAAVALSNDEGTSWTRTLLGGRRIHAFLEVDGIVYATDVFAGPRATRPASRPTTRSVTRPARKSVPVHEFNGTDGFTPREDLTASVLFPGITLKPGQSARVVQPVAWNGGTAYLGGYVHNDHQFKPFGVYFAKNLARGKVDVQSLPLPEKTLAWDLLVHEGDLFILASTEATLAFQPAQTRPATAQMVRVLKTADFKTSNEVLNFLVPTFARSFAYLDGSFYFGLGCEIEDDQQWTQEELHPRTGEILRVPETPKSSG